jgi:hypothetical protein
MLDIQWAFKEMVECGYEVICEEERGRKLEGYHEY